MNLDSEEKFIQLMTLENASLKRFVKFLVDISEQKYTSYRMNKIYMYLFPILYFLY